MIATSTIASVCRGIFMERVIIILRGRVQGVFFRHSARVRAGRLEITGTAENLPDGSLRIVAEGERTKLEEIIAWARRGPPLARVDEITLTWEQPSGQFTRFRIL